jgi:hypothetical protein
VNVLLHGEQQERVVAHVVLELLLRLAGLLGVGHRGQELLVVGRVLGQREGAAGEDERELREQRVEQRIVDGDDREIAGVRLPVGAALDERLQQLRARDDVRFESHVDAREELADREVDRRARLADDAAEREALRRARLFEQRA